MTLTVTKTADGLVVQDTDPVDDQAWCLRKDGTWACRDQGQWFTLSASAVPDLIREGIQQQWGTV